MNIKELDTERSSMSTADLDTRSALEIAHIINREDHKVAAAVERALPQIAQAIDVVVEAILGGGRLIYVGAGTSGRIAALDAAECPPTFSTDPKTVRSIIAGGDKALTRATEVSEDSRQAGRRDLVKSKSGRKDVVVGVAASGRTPYTVAAVEYARKHGAKTVAIVAVTGSELGRAAEIEIVVDTGPEVVSGSTRMKAGTAQKMVLNMLTTGAMARLGYVYGNLMVNVHTKNEKLVERGLGILEKAASVDRATAAGALKAARNSVALALIMLRTKVTRAQAEEKLKAAKGNVRKAIEST
ncbi:MAG TPA: N-acetylmuramic acid 6-phosphate etherase [Terriglobales bacterium]